MMQTFLAQLWTHSLGHKQRCIIASNPGSPFRILSRSFGEKSDFSPKLRDKIRNREPGFEASCITLPSTCRSKVNKLQTLWSEVVVYRIMKHTSQFIHARLVLVISTIELLRCICSYLSLVGLAWTSWNQWPHPQRWAAPFFRFIHIIKVLSSSPAHTHTCTPENEDGIAVIPHSQASHILIYALWSICCC